MSTLKTVNIQHPSSSTINGTLDTSGNTSFAGNLAFNSGYGSVATAYGCRAWVNFNGTGTVAINGSGNVTSITDGGTGVYTVNITNAMPDANYSGVFSCGAASGTSGSLITSQTTTAIALACKGGSGTAADYTIVNVAIFR